MILLFERFKDAMLNGISKMTCAVPLSITAG